MADENFWYFMLCFGVVLGILILAFIRSVIYSFWMEAMKQGQALAATSIPAEHTILTIDLLAQPALPEKSGHHDQVVHSSFSTLRASGHSKMVTSLEKFLHQAFPQTLNTPAQNFPRGLALYGFNRPVIRSTVQALRYELESSNSGDWHYFHAFSLHSGKAGLASLFTQARKFPRSLIYLEDAPHLFKYYEGMDPYVYNNSLSHLTKEMRKPIQGEILVVIGAPQWIPGFQKVFPKSIRVPNLSTSQSRKAFVQECTAKWRIPQPRDEVLEMVADKTAHLGGTGVEINFVIRQKLREICEAAYNLCAERYFRGMRGVMADSEEVSPTKEDWERAVRSVLPKEKGKDVVVDMGAFNVE